MPCHDRVYAWRAEVAARLPRLSRPQATVLALWSFGVVPAGACGRTAVGTVLAAGLACGEDALRQRPREFRYSAAHKRGAKRREVAAEGCFAPLLGWVLGWWDGTQLAPALDATTPGDRFAVLAVSVVYRGCAIPVAWAVPPGTTPRAWRREWLLRVLGPAVPAGWTVLVLADRGLYARWLYRRIVRLGWHPFLRVTAGGTFRPTGRARYAPLWSFAAAGRTWAGTGTAFQGPGRRLACTLPVRWADGCAQPWLLLTDLPPAAADPCRYGMRAWIERGFKRTKRAGWQRQATRVTDPDRAARLWLAVAVARLWLVGIGGAADAALPPSTIAVLPTAPRRVRRATRPRLVSVFRRGHALLLAALLNDRPPPTGRFRPEPWPLTADSPSTRAA